MKVYLLICYLIFCFINSCSSTLVDGIVTLSWSRIEPAPVIDRFLTNNTQIKLKLQCRETTVNASTVREQIKKKIYKFDKVKETNIKIRGRIGRITGCLPLQSDLLLTPDQDNDKNLQTNIWQKYYEQIWKQMEQRTFTASQTDCDYTGIHVNIEQYSPIKKAEITQKDLVKLRKQQTKENKNNKKTRRATDDNDNKVSPLVNGLRSSAGTFLTWGDGFYLIEIYEPEVTNVGNNIAFDVDVIVEMKNSHGGYISADEHPALVFYVVMCVIYALFAVLWFVFCAFYWRELLKIQFWIGGVILIGMIEKSAFLAEYDTLNRNGTKVYYAIISAEILSCLKRTVSRMLVIIVALGYGIVKPRLGPLKQKVLGMGLLYFSIATVESLLRINTKNDETNNKVLISRIPLAVVDAIIYYWIFTGLVATTKQLPSLLFMIWSLKSRFFTTCITNWREFWVDDAFWHILFSIILLVIMFLFRPSNNNQRYAFVPLLDHAGSDNDEFDDGDDERGESAVFDSITMRKASNVESGIASKNKKQQQAYLNREANVSSGGNGNNTVEDALTWVEDNIPTSIADQTLQAFDDDDEIVDTKLERSKMQ